jgi:hypothetical protein
MGGGGLGLITAPATEAILGAVPKEKAGVGSAVNDATRLFGAALGVAVIGSIAASLYHSHLTATIPPGLPAQAAAAARGSVGGALVAASSAGAAGHALANAAVGAFLHSVSGSLKVAGAVALAGAIMAALLLPARPRVEEDAIAEEAMWVSGARRLRERPSLGAAVVGAARGTVYVIRREGDWAEVRSEQLNGWLPRPFLLPAPSPVDAA